MSRWECGDNDRSQGSSSDAGTPVFLGRTRCGFLWNGQIGTPDLLEIDARISPATTRRRLKMWLNPTKYWIRCLLDTGATVHAVGRRSVLKNFDSSIKIRVRGFDGSMRMSLGAGTLELEVPSTDGTGTVVVLKRVLLLPNLGDQVIISPGKLENEAGLFEF